MSPGGHNAKLFINYRREDSAPYAGRLYDRLSAHFDSDQVFIDIDQIEPGEDFVEAINRKVGACEIAIVLIGPDWLHLTDAAGKRRLDDKEDFVRMEINAALQRKIRVIPVLVGGARMPRKEDMPEDLAALSRRNAIELSETRFHADVDRLIEAIEKPRVAREQSAEASLAPAERVPGPSLSPNEPRNRITFNRAAWIVAGIAVVAVCLIWALSLRRPLQTKSPAQDATDSVASLTATKATRPTVNPAPAGGTLADNLPTPEDTAKSVTVPLVNKGFPTMKEQADEWISDVRNRADGGSATAQFEMGSFYEFGLGSLSPDPATAIEWYRKAATQGHTLAKEGLEDLSRSVALPSPDEQEALKLEMRRLARQSKGTDGMLDDMNAKALDAIKHIKK